MSSASMPDTLTPIWPPVLKRKRARPARGRSGRWKVSSRGSITCSQMLRLTRHGEHDVRRPASSSKVFEQGGAHVERFAKNRLFSNPVIFNKEKGWILVFTSIDERFRADSSRELGRRCSAF